MILNLYLNDEQSEQLLAIVDHLKDPDVTAEDFANEIFHSTLSKVWERLTKEVIN